MTGIHEVIETLKTEYQQDDGMLFLILMEGIESLRETNKAILEQHPEYALPGFDHMLKNKLDEMYKYLEEESGYEF